MSSAIYKSRLRKLDAFLENGVRNDADDSDDIDGKNQCNRLDDILSQSASQVPSVKKSSKKKKKPKAKKRVVEEDEDFERAENSHDT